MESVDGWKPDDGPPRKVESKVIMTDVNRAEVPIFIYEEIHDIDGVKDGSDHDGVGDVTVGLVLIGDEREITSDE